MKGIKAAFWGSTSGDIHIWAESLFTHGIMWALLLNKCIEFFQDKKSHDSVVNHIRITIYDSSQLMGWGGWTMASIVSV